MKNIAIVRGLLGLTGVYDGVLGIGFLVAGPRIFEACGITPPNHWGYVHFGAAVLIIFALMFFAAARRPVANRNLIPYGVLLKVAYCGVVFYHWFLGSDLPGAWKVFAFIDLATAVALAWAYTAVQAGPGGSTARA